MIRGEIEVWEEGNYRPFSGFFKIESNNQIKKGCISRAGTKKKLKCYLRSENPQHLFCGVDLKENPSPKEILRFRFQDLPERGLMKVQGTNFLGQPTFWICTFTISD